jgi:two-component system chemotaxis response regulator CheB
MSKIAEKIKVLVVDDSDAVRRVIANILNLDPEIEVIGFASDPYEAVSKIAENIPDVITLDIEMPRMDGLTFLKKLMKQHPIPVVIISSVAGEGTENGLTALSLGAKEIITKPKLSNKELLNEYSIRIIDAIKAAALTYIGAKKLTRTPQRKILLANQQENTIGKNLNSNPVSEEIIMIGASTGGPELISKILKNLRTDLPGIMIVQHMPGEFTKLFANRLNSECALNVKEAENGDVIRRGAVYIANGYRHLLLSRDNGVYKCKLEDGPLVNRHRPCVDVLFNSALKYPAKSITAILLTGMGADGSKGMLNLREAGAMTFAQDEKSSVIFGMPKEAIRLDAAIRIGNPDELINWLNTTYKSDEG